MAIVKKPTAIRVRLDERIEYAITGKKTRLLDRIDYAINPEKTAVPEKIFTSFINCSDETAFEDMMEVKRFHKKEKGVMGYSIIQSFAPGEVTPEQAHEIGVRLATEYFGERFQVVIGTHLDKAHIHNHIIVNSVSFTDGRKYDNKLYHLDEMRSLSDRLCREYGLSVLQPNEVPQIISHKEWREKKKGIPLPDDLIRTDIDAAIAASFSFHEFVMNMQKLGYSVRYGKTIKHMSITPPGDNRRSRRVYRLGERYSEETIRQRVQENQIRHPLAALMVSTNRRHAANRFPRRVPTKLTGIRALYYKYLYQLGVIRKRPYTSNRRTAYAMRGELINLERYVEHYRLLNKHKISTFSQLQAYRSEVEMQLERLLGERDAIYSKLRSQKNADVISAQRLQCSKLSEQIKDARKQVRFCREIEDNSRQILSRQEKINQIQTKETERHKRQLEQDREFNK